jgi:hypothetical protein
MIESFSLTVLSASDRKHYSEKKPCAPPLKQTKRRLDSPSWCANHFSFIRP